MAQIFRGSDQTLLIENEDQYDEMQELVQNYWGVEEAEKIFPIPYWKIKQLLIASTSEEIALKVTDIELPTLVNAEWVVFEEGDEETLSDNDYRPDDHYYVVDEAMVNSIRAGAVDIDIHEFVVCGRIGKTESEGNLHAFVYGYQCAALDPPGSGDGATSGIKIPPGGGDE